MRKREDFKAMITRVVDGDSLEFRRGGFWRNFFGIGKVRRLRLYGIDAPELSQPLGSVSQAALSREIRGFMRIRVMDVDRYGRVVGLLYRDDPMDSVNLRMVQSGMAYWYKRYGGAQWGFEEAEASARAESVGVWADEDAVRPWDYRAGEREAGGLSVRWLLILGLVVVVLAVVMALFGPLIFTGL